MHQQAPEPTHCTLIIPLACMHVVASIALHALAAACMHMQMQYVVATVPVHICHSTSAILRACELCLTKLYLAMLIHVDIHTLLCSLMSNWNVQLVDESNIGEFIVEFKGPAESMRLHGTHHCMKAQLHA